jgi:long-chain acyl-CoA synthetase
MIGRSVAGEKECFEALLSSITVDGKILSLGQLLERSHRLFPENVAIIFEDKEYTYKELYSRACEFSKKVVAQGVKPRDRVLIFIENSFEFFIAYYGVAQTGAVVAPLNTFLHEVELTHIINDSKPSLIVSTSIHVPLFKKIESSKNIPLLTEQDIDLTTPVNVAASFPPYALEPEEMAALLYTSGTTGMPKGVMLSSKNIMTNVVQGIARLELEVTEKLFGALPLFHSFSQVCMVWATIFSGCCVIVVPKIERRYLLAALKHNPTIVVGVPALFGLFCLLKTAPFSSVKYFASGGDALPDKIRMAFALIYRRKICNGYGLTEATPIVSIDLDDVTEPTSCIGRPVMGLEAKIIDEHGTSLKQGDIGELIVKGDNIMLGYYNAPEMTAKVIKDGWLYTGDLAYIADNGKIIITGRIKDLIIHKGFNVYPQEIENVIMSHPNVVRVGVVGKPDEGTGEVPIAFVQIRATQENIEKELKALCVGQLAAYKVPKDFFVTTDNLPTTATGKVDKKILRKKF